MYTERTTTAPECASPTSKPDTLLHTYWTADARLAQELGVEFPALCGVFLPPFDVETEHVESRPGISRDECLTCFAVYVASDLTDITLRAFPQVT